MGSALGNQSEGDPSLDVAADLSQVTPEKALLPPLREKGAGNRGTKGGQVPTAPAAVKGRDVGRPTRQGRAGSQGIRVHCLPGHALLRKCATPKRE